MAVNNNDNPKYAAAAEELFSAISGWSDSSKRLDDATKRAEALMKNLSGFADSINRTLESSMTFATREMNKSFGQYTRSFAKAQGEAAIKLNDEKVSVKETLDRLNDAIEDLDSAAKASGKAVDETVKNALIQKRDQAQLHFNNLNNIKSEQAFKIQTINELRKFSINVVTNMANSIVKIYQDAMANAYNKFSSTWENTYGTNTSYNAYSKSEYNAVIDSLQKFIKDKGLTNTISINDYQEEISNILKGGLTGPLATTVAKYSVLSKEGGISADFSDPAFLKMINKMEREGRDVEQYLSQIMTQSKGVIAEVGNSFGFANGQINTMMDSMYQLSDVTNMSDKALKESITAMTAFNGVLGDTNVDISGIYSNITKYATGGLVGASKQSLLDFSGMTGEQMRNKIESEGMESVLKDTIKGIYNMYDGKEDPEFVSKVNEALGGNYKDEEIYSLLNKYDNYEDFEAEFSKTLIAANKTTEQQYFDKLEDYQTEQEKLNNTAENQLSELGQLAKHSVIIERLITGVIGAITTTAMFGKNGLINSSNGNKLKSLFDGIWNGKTSVKDGVKFNANTGWATINGKRGKLGSKWTEADIFNSTGGLKNLFTNGAKGLGAGKAGSIASKITSSKLGSTVFSTGGKALGVAGSLLNMGIDAYKGYQEDGTAGAFRGAITGSGKRAESGWDVAKGTGSAALKGAGIGMAFGPLGAAIGGAVGAVAGLTTTLIDYNSEEGKAARATKKTSEALTKLADSASSLNKSQQSLKDTVDLATKASEGSEDAQKKLLKKYPEYATSLEGLSTESDEYKEIISKIITLESRKTAEDFGEAFTSSTSKTTTKGVNTMSLSDQKTLVNASIGSKIDSVAGKAKAEIVAGENDSVMTDLKGNLIYRKYTGRNAYGEDMYDDEVKYNPEDYRKKLVDLGIDASNFSSDEIWGTARKVGLLDIGDHLSHLTDKVDKKYSSEDYKAIMANIQNARDVVDPITSNIGSYYNDFNSWTDLIANGGVTKESLDKAFAYYNYLASFGLGNTEEKSIFKSATGYSWKDYVDSFPKITETDENGSEKELKITPSVLHNKYNYLAKFSETPMFAVGLNYVPYDNFYARLHKGEKIVTAADAALERASVKGNSMIPALQNALVSQTDIIIGILEKIYSNMSGKPSGLTGEFSSSVPSIASTI